MGALRIALINMPFADANRPSIALAQLRSVVHAAHDSRARASIFHLNLDFARWFGFGVYSLIANSMDVMVSGLGDWFFRSAAFPDQEDNAVAYFERYPRGFGARQKEMQALLGERRAELPRFLDELIDRYGLDGFDVAGFSSMFQQNVACFAMAGRLKQRRRGIVTLLGGANCETPMGQVIARNVDAIDFVFSGPSLRSFPQLLGNLLDGRPERSHGIKGVFSRQRLAAAEGRPLDEVGEELDIEHDVPIDYSDYFESVDRLLPDAPIQTSLLFETSRGCWWGQKAHCTFCGLNGLGMGYRAMKPEKALRQFEKLFEHAPRVARFEAVDNIMPREYLKEVFPRLRAPRDMFYEVKADLHESDLSVLSRAGVRQIQPGIEALATSTLRLMKKGTTASQNVRLLKGCLRYGIKPVWNLLVGFPGEEEAAYAKYAEDIPRLMHLPPPTGVYPVRFDRFSPYFNQRDTWGLRLKPYAFYPLVYPFAEAELTDLAYFFSDEAHDAPYMRTMIRWLFPLREKVSQWHARWLQNDGRARPELYLDRSAGVPCVRDSRSGDVTTVEVGETGSRILELLATPLPSARLARELPQLSAAQLESSLALLQQHGLIFSDGERLLSLLVSPDAAQDAQAESVALHATP